MICRSCFNVWHNGRRSEPVPAVAIWTYRVNEFTGEVVITGLCQTSLDHWFDNADDDPDLEPVRVEWLDGSRVLANES